ncbi:hypothetical protein AWB68_02438 [Caballeronia choica]|uniref:Replication protein O n=1 Tax=Caballeronia choica TaxID=326476 RepID=A0A158HY07_9BURK|nr:Replication protein O [Caballeronia choica]SAL49198.1 hypothetical protein AWB68_02438 [Caballeronia choica]
MSIAQRLVAGEGDLHPAHNEPNELAVDSAALTAFRCDSTNLPWVIFRAAFRASHVEQISPRARAVLSALARTVDVSRPFAAIFARRELLTGRALQSMRTFYRSLGDLESAGLIERRPQSRYVEAGLFGRAYLHLTAHAAALLGLVEQAPAQVARQPISAPPPNLSEPRHPSANLADGAIYKDLSPSSFQKRQPGQVPSDLQRLRSLGFIDFLIFKLMREAREQGKRLSDVVEATWEHLKAAATPINYLRALLRSPVDFGRQLRRKIEARAEERNRLDLLAHAEHVARNSAGQTFIDINALRKYVVDAVGQSMMVYAVDEGVGRQAAGWKEKFAEAIQRGHIRIASHEDLEAFAQSRRRHVALASQSAGGGSQADGKPEVTLQVRDHIAGLRSILRHHARTFARTT